MATTSQNAIFPLRHRHKTSHFHRVTKHHLILMVTTSQNTLLFPLQQRHKTPSHSHRNHVTNHNLTPIATSQNTISFHGNVTKHHLIPIATLSENTISFPWQRHHKTPLPYKRSVTKHHLIPMATSSQNTITLQTQQRHKTPFLSIVNIYECCICFCTTYRNTIARYNYRYYRPHSSYQTA
jgi:hypothetical protein